MNLFFTLGNQEFRSILHLPKLSQRGRRLKLTPVIVGSGKVDLTEHQNYWRIMADQPTLIAYVRESDANREPISYDEVVSLSNGPQGWDSCPEFRGLFTLEYRESRSKSSYMAEIPSFMIGVSSATVSDLSAHLSIASRRRFLFFASWAPGMDHKRGYLVDDDQKKVLIEAPLTAFRDGFEIDRKVGQKITFVAPDALGIPIVGNLGGEGFLSVEHTQPPHSFLLTKDFSKIKRYKERYVSLLNA